MLIRVARLFFTGVLIFHCDAMLGMRAVAFCGGGHKSLSAAEAEEGRTHAHRLRRCEEQQADQQQGLCDATESHAEPMMHKPSQIKQPRRQSLNGRKQPGHLHLQPEPRRAFLQHL